MSDPPQPGAPEEAPSLLVTGILDSRDAGPRVIRGGVIRVAGYVAGVVLSVGSAAVLIRYLGVTDFGRYITVMSLVTIVGGLSEAGMTNIGIREFSTREGAGRDALMRTLLGIRLGLTAVGTVVAVIFSLLAGYDETMVAGVAIGGLGLALTVQQQTYAIPLTAGLRLGWVSGLELIRQAVTVAGIVALVAAGATLLAFFVVPVPAAVAALAVTIVLVRAHLSLRPSLDGATLRDLAPLILPFAAAAAVGTIYVQLVVVLMSVLSDPLETGYFGAAFRVFTVLGGVPALLVASAYPVLARAARDDHDRLGYALQRLYDVSLIAGGWMAVGTVLGAPVAIAVVAGDGFDPSISVLQIQGLALAASFLLATGGYALMSLNRLRALLVTNLVGLVATAALATVLIPRWGADGGAAAALAGESLLALGYAIALRRSGSSAGARISSRTLAPVLLAAGASSAPAVLLDLPAVAAVAAATIVYFVILFGLRVIPDELVDALLARLPGR
ncbi:MAG: polysaccharide biosynthesis C-terminal domain-containing protein [Solirubrobacterales bacterium]